MRLLLLFMMPTAGMLSTAHAQHADDKVEVHHVRLTGHTGDAKFDRDYTLKVHAGCVERNRAMGWPVKTQSVADLPPVLHQLEIDFYYASNRMLQLHRHIDYYLDQKDCSIPRTETRLTYLDSSAGLCTMHHERGEASGDCDSGAHAHASPEHWQALAPSGPDSKMMTAPLPPDLPPEIRDRVEAHRQQRRESPPWPQPTGERRTMAGVSCEVYALSKPIRREQCIARPSASRFPIPSSRFNRSVPGLLLSTESTPPGLTLHTEEVHLNKLVPERLFRVPGELRVVTPKGIKP
ncbi:hypothetical protein [Caldimonas brevitalea]|uniref:hypothetical protein n=1 Tax=Caldimonas brevitalea TaxID=413882 RepID=UPI0012FA4FA6|nr:hypothetical protein [Caldimonas brevitalea]